MANLASSGVVVADSYTRDGNNAKKHNAYRVTMTLSSMGSATNKILATAFGLVKIRGCSNAVLSTGAEVLPAAPSIDGTYILLGGGASNAPADYTGAYDITVWGTPV